MEFPEFDWSQWFETYEWSGVFEWRGQNYQLPSEDEMRAMMDSGIAETPEGGLVELDDPDGWPCLLGRCCAREGE